MVIRLGEGSSLVDLGQRYRILQGQSLQLQYAGDAVVTIRAWARIRYDNGEDSLLFIPDAVLVSDRLPALCPPSDVARMDGWVTDALVELPLDATIKRGRVYVRLFLDPFGPELCADYCYSIFGQVALGTYIQPGPGGGGGHLDGVAVKTEGVPAAATTRTLAATNTVRKVYGFHWYYLASGDAASRVLTVVLRGPSGAKPTGFPAIDTWAIAGITLTLSQAGSLFADEERSGSNDNGTILIADAASAPSPFPLLVEEEDEGALVFSTADLHANDLDTIYVLQEEWVLL